ncbi:DUF4189 domain-containing protein [Tsukamurella paurometabola]|uniref:DUF4189 domain-containing protein n=1 Tax=Tsukamurella paurometabola TaxID=2061 RepID=A0A3P8LCX5_TSUPA|nr:DUF4189 domain-containing protein [Tsukamurella paurometabola]MBS4101889.1 DUF4189 domain-containing protein [Tsukamurella paurometabola]UEA84947.1 DUF4189 domain-containing protein [Tsukamurella paurometabola]VDR37542.1 Uncharacterised protein [Tsukamurella paurometabola]
MKTLTRKAFVAAVATASVAGGIQVAVAAPAANAAVNFGAIAVASNGASGRSWDYPSRAAAERAALNSCGWGSCRVLASFANGCGAVAETRTRFQGGTGRSLYAAQRSATSLAGGGTIKVWQCTSGHL